MNRCLYCYNPLESGDFHSKCSKKFFGTPVPPEIPFGLSEIDSMALQVVERSVALTGVQSKLSMSLERPKKTDGEIDPVSRLTIVGLWGNFILKPPSTNFECLPENEDVTMHLAGLAGLNTAEHTLIRLKSGELAYVTKRFDRTDSDLSKKHHPTKLHMEDMCQILEKMTEQKYLSSVEKIGKAISRYSDSPGNDLFLYFSQLIFCFLTGNADMHLKNIALLRKGDDTLTLSPAYDLVCTKIALPTDLEETALTLNAKRSKIKREDFNQVGNTLAMPENVISRLFADYSRKVQSFEQKIDQSFLGENLKEDYKNLIAERARRLSI